MTRLIRFLDISRNQWSWMAFGILLGIFVIISNTLLMAVSGWFIASMAVSGSSGAAFNYFIPSAAIRLLAISRTIGRYAERLVTHEATFRLLADLRIWLFSRFEPLAPACLERYADGDIAGRLRADVDAIENLYLKIVAPLSVGIISMFAGLLFLLYYCPSAAAAMLLFLLLSGIGMPLLVRRLSELPGRKTARLSAELRNRVTEGLNGFEELILLGAVERQAIAVEDLSAGLIVEQERLGRINGITLAGMALFAGCGITAVLLTAGFQVISLQITGPHLVMLLLFSAALFEAAGQMPSAFHHIPATLESAARIFDLSDTPAPVPDTPVVCEIPTHGGICFTNVAASYLPDAPVLENLSFNVPEGSIAVLIGPSGIGKSLIVEIMLRFRNYDGNISVGGIEIREMSKELLVGMISAVPQRPHLFNGTIRDNILLGNLHADEEQLKLALRDSCLTEWINVLPLGLDTLVGIKGAAVSGGEARRIALARALLKEAPILLLDEPTEGLDGVTEREVVLRLKERFSNSKTTVMVISHRPACFDLCSQVIRL